MGGILVPGILRGFLKVGGPAPHKANHNPVQNPRQARGPSMTALQPSPGAPNLSTPFLAAPGKINQPRPPPQTTASGVSSWAQGPPSTSSGGPILAFSPFPFLLPCPILASTPHSQPDLTLPNVCSPLFIPKDIWSACYGPGPGLGLEDSAVNEADGIPASGSSLFCVHVCVLAGN